MSEQRKYWTFTAQQKLEIVLAGVRGDRSKANVMWLSKHGGTLTL